MVGQESRLRKSAAPAAIGSLSASRRQRRAANVACAILEGVGRQRRQVAAEVGDSVHPEPPLHDLPAQAGIRVDRRPSSSPRPRPRSRAAPPRPSRTAPDAWPAEASRRGGSSPAGRGCRRRGDAPRSPRGRRGGRRGSSPAARPWRNRRRRDPTTASTTGVTTRSQSGISATPSRHQHRALPGAVEEDAVVAPSAGVDGLREVHVGHRRVVAVRADHDRTRLACRGVRGPEEVPGHRVAVEGDRERLSRRVAERHRPVERRREPVEGLAQALVDGRAVEDVDAPPRRRTPRAGSGRVRAAP